MLIGNPRLAPLNETFNKVPFGKKDFKNILETCLYLLNYFAVILADMFLDVNLPIRSLKSRDTMVKRERTKGQRTTNDVQNTTQKTKD